LRPGRPVGLTIMRGANTMRSEAPARPAAGGDAVPLFVDVDGTLTRADISLESFVRVARSGFWALLGLLAAMLRGRAAAKAIAARRDPVDPSALPYRQDVLDLIADAKAQGRPVILASASHWRNIHRIARHLELSDQIIATRARANLKGPAKLAAIRARIGAEGHFDYVGDSKADKCLWREAREGWTVGYRPGAAPNARPDAGNVTRLGEKGPGLLRTLAKAMRPHQWAKNALVFVPALTSGMILDAGVLFTVALTAIFVSFVASSVYLMNDLLDIDADRAHRTKWRRPLAHGDLSIPAGIALSAVLAAAGLGGAWLLGGPWLAAWLAVYMMVSTAYSLRLKSMMVGDAVVLAALYTIRIWIGAIAIGVALSFWLLLFSVFLFVCLAYLKRSIDMRAAVDPKRLLSGPGYVGGELDVVMASRVSAGMGSVLALARYSRDAAARGRCCRPF